MRRLALLVTLSSLAVGSWIVGDTQPADPGGASTQWEIERSDQGEVGVNLRGGPVGYESGTGRAKRAAATGVVRGQVFDAQGIPASNIIVLGGTAPTVLGDVLGGSDAAYTDDEGRFELALDDGASVVALHLEGGMSRVVTAEADAQVRLALEPFAWVEGFVREHASPSEARVILQSTDRPFSFATQTDASGHYTAGPLPPGTYRVETYDESAANGVVAFPSPLIEVMPGLTTTQDILETDPGTVRVDYRRTDGLRIATVSVALFEGQRTIDSDERYVAAFREHKGVYGTSTIGQHDEYTTFRGVPDGVYTACARSNLGEQGMHVSCESVTVGDGVSDVDLKLYAG